MRPILISLPLIFLLLAAAVPLTAQSLSAYPPETQALIKAGQGYSARKDFGQAIGRYEQVLEQDPDNVVALYEKAYCQYMMDDYAQCLVTAERVARTGFKADPGYVSKFYVLMGNCHNKRKKPDKAIESYLRGLAVFPTSPALHYNLGLTYKAKGDQLRARESFKKAVACDPRHPGSHYELAKIFFREGYRVPALLVLGRYLTLDPGSVKGEEVLGMLRKVLAGKGPEENRRTDEGSFQALLDQLALTAQAVRKAGEDGEAQAVTEGVERLAGLMTELYDKKTGNFTEIYLMPYFINMKANGQTATWVRVVLNDRVWLRDNGQPLQEFREWDRIYKWRPPDEFLPPFTRIGKR